MPELKYQALVLDVLGTILTYKTGETEGTMEPVPVNPRIIQILKNLKEKGVRLFALSALPEDLFSAGFPENLLEVFESEGADKGWALEVLLRKNNLSSQSVLCLTDRKDGKEAAGANRVPFEEIHYYDVPNLGYQTTQTVLTRIFGEEIIGKKDRGYMKPAKFLKGKLKGKPGMGGKGPGTKIKLK